VSAADRPVALVAGAAGELGDAIRAALHERDWVSAALDYSEADGEHSLALDLCDREAVSQAVDALSALGPVSCLVLASVSHERRAFSEITPELWRQTLRAHVVSAANLCWAVLPAMMDRGRGNIVTLSSAAALGEPALGAHSVAGAGALIGFAKALAIEVAPSGVQVNVVAPSLQRPRPADVAATVCYLAEEPHFFTGQVLSPNAGAVI
jgi:2-hydroxycyclohexanecarboxyl-CoA dehydrogenase